MSLPIDRTAKIALDANLVNGVTSDAPKLKANNDVLYNTIDELYNYAAGLVQSNKLSEMGIINVKDYGAKGDGSTDNSTFIQNAVNAAESAGGGIVFFPSASAAYNFSTQIEVPDKVYLLGAGEDLVTLHFTGVATQAIVAKTGSDYYTQILGGFRLTGSSLLGGGTTQFHSSRIVSRISGERYAFVSGVIRYEASKGGWYVQDDENHTPIGISGVSVVGDRVRITYNFTAKEAVGLVITPDDELLSKGYTVTGCGVGLTSCEFKYGRLVDIYGRAIYNTSTSQFQFESLTNTNQYQLTFENRPNGVIRIRHDSDDVGLLPIQLTGFGGSYIPQVGVFSSTYFDVQFYDRSTGAQVTSFDANMKFMFRRGGYTVPDVSTGYPYPGNFFVVGIMKV